MASATAHINSIQNVTNSWEACAQSIVYKIYNCSCSKRPSSLTVSTMKKVPFSDDSWNIEIIIFNFSIYIYIYHGVTLPISAYIDSPYLLVRQSVWRCSFINNKDYQLRFCCKYFMLQSFFTLFTVVLNGLYLFKWLIQYLNYCLCKVFIWQYFCFLSQCPQFHTEFAQSCPANNANSGYRYGKPMGLVD